MSFIVNVIDKQLIVNSIPIADLSRPFYGIADRRVRKCSLNKLLVDSRDCLQGTRGARYKIKFDDNRALMMYQTWSLGLKSQGIYETFKNISVLFQIKSLEFILTGINNGKYPEIKLYLGRIFELILNTFEADCVVTDMEWVASEIDLPIIVPKWSSYTTLGPYNLPLSKVHSTRYVELLENEYGSSMPRDILSYKKPLVLIGTNKYYAGFLGQLLGRRLSVLPVTVFLVVGS